MIVAYFRELFEARFMLDSTRQITWNQFRYFHQGEISVQAFARRFSNLALFYPKDVAIYTLRPIVSIML